MEEAYLTVKELAELKGCTERYIRNQISKQKIYAIEINGQVGGSSGTHYRIPLSKLEEKIQIKFKRRFKRLQKEAFKEETEKEEQETIQELTEKEQQEILYWKRLLQSWRAYREDAKEKEKADEEFIKLISIQQGGASLNRRTLYRKWKALKEKGERALLDGRGKHKNHKSKMTKEILDVFEYYYLDQNQPSIQQCMRETQLYFQSKKEEIELPSYATFKRSAEKIPFAVKVYFRKREKEFIDKCAPYIKRMYEDLESNDIWVADNHTFDIMVEKEGKAVRVYLTAFMDVRSRKMTGWCVTEVPGSDATIYALKKGCEKWGIPKCIYTDNGREFLFHDLGGNGFRKKRKAKEEMKLPSILEDLDITFRTALPRNARGKGIERAFYTIKEHFSKLFAAYTGGTILERPDRLKKMVKEGKGLPNIEEFMKFVDIYIEGWYNKQPHTGEGMKGESPDHIFEKHLTTQRVLPKEKGDLMFMRYAKSNTGMLKVRKNGVSLTFYGKELQYWSEAFWKEHLGENVYVRYNPEDLSSVKVYDQEKRYLCDVPLKEELGYKATKEEVRKKQEENRSAVKEIAKYKAQKEIQPESQLKLVLERALENMEHTPQLSPKVIEPLFSQQEKNMPLQKASGGEEVIDWDVAIERLKKAKENG